VTGGAGNKLSRGNYRAHRFVKADKRRFASGKPVNENTARRMMGVYSCVLILPYTQSAQKTNPHAVLKKSSTHAGICVVDVGELDSRRATRLGWSQF
jgi:hypothetical protein